MAHMHKKNATRSKQHICGITGAFHECGCTGSAHQFKFSIGFVPSMEMRVHQAPTVNVNPREIDAICSCCQTATGTNCHSALLPI